MATRRVGNGRANALKQEIVIRVEERPRSPAEVVYDLLADLRSHLVWAGERQGKKTRLVSLEAPEGPAGVGTEFRTEGTDPMGQFTDFSVVTEATRPRVFEFVTEACLQTKKGKRVDWTNVHRYELVSEGGSCCIRRGADHAHQRAPRDARRIQGSRSVGPRSQSVGGASPTRRPEPCPDGRAAGGAVSREAMGGGSAAGKGGGMHAVHVRPHDDIAV